MRKGEMEAARPAKNVNQNGLTRRAKPILPSLEAGADRMMREYRAQLDAERARKLFQGRNHSGSKSKHGKDKRDKVSKKHNSKRRKHSRRSSSWSLSSSSYSSCSSEEEEKASRRSKSRNKGSGTGSDDDGPVPLSRFFGNVKS
ncbi:hypothetical protein Lal_00031979 [Lupinus albus]|nr:hypothetical protein Lal_00031979 [Lupinus albus]